MEQCAFFLRLINKIRYIAVAVLGLTPKAKRFHPLTKTVKHKKQATHGKNRKAITEPGKCMEEYYGMFLTAEDIDPYIPYIPYLQ